MKINDVDFISIDRSLVIGGTDASVLLGVNKWKNRDQLLLEKAGKYKVEQNDAMYWGVMAEPMIAKHIEANFIEDNQLLFNPAEHHPQVAHPEYPFIVGSPDRLVIDKDTQEVVEGVEIKTSFEWALKGWKKGVPDYYIPQAQVYMMCLGFSSWRLFALVGNRTFLHYTIEEDLFMQEEIIDKSKAFYKEMLEQDNKDCKEALKKYETILEG